MSAADRSGRRRRWNGETDKPRTLVESFKHACAGVAIALKTQRNMRIHLLLTVVVLLSAAALRVPGAEMAILVLTVSSVWVTELVNTAIEAAVDLESPEPHPLARVAKDVAAGAVLVSALAALAVAYFVLFDEIRILLDAWR